MIKIFPFLADWLVSSHFDHSPFFGFKICMRTPCQIWGNLCKLFYLAYLLPVFSVNLSIYVNHLRLSLHSKRFRLVSEQKKTEERDFRFWPREKWNESQKMREGGGGGEGRKRLQTNPSILKTCVRQRTQRLIGSASQTILTCVDQRFVSYWEVMIGTWHASSCGCCLFWSARFTFQCKSIFFNFFWNVKLFLRIYKGFRSFNLFSKVAFGSK